MRSRIYQRTGFALTQGPVARYRVANASYGVLNPEKRHEDGLRDDWSRWDTPGRTIYVANTLETAFRQCLPWARMVPRHKKKLGRLAALLDIGAEDVMREVAADILKLGHMQPGLLPFE